jgi:hypothetical protein
MRSLHELNVASGQDAAGTAVTHSPLGQETAAPHWGVLHMHGRVGGANKSVSRRRPVSWPRVGHIHARTYVTLLLLNLH